MPNISLIVNGEPVEAHVEPRTLLVHFIREHMGLTGSHVGCDTSQCGACAVHLNGRAIKACTILAVQASGGDITTIEGLATEDGLHPVQKAFHEEHGLQCGFCTPGMVMTTVDMIRRNVAMDDASIRAELKGNLCRCTGYQNIVKAIQRAAKDMEVSS